MKKLNINKLNVMKSISKKTLKLLAIDFFFYFFITFGFLIFSTISYKYKIDPVNSSIAWTVVFIPLLFLKIRKDLLYGEKRNK